MEDNIMEIDKNEEGKQSDGKPSRKRKSKTTKKSLAKQNKTKAANESGASRFDTLLETGGLVVTNSLPEPLMPFISGAPQFSADAAPEKQLPEKPKRSSRPKENLATIKEPEKVTNVESSGDATEIIVQRIMKVLTRAFKDNGRKPINYFRFVVDPNSFSRTLENIFHVSFLIRDGHAMMEILSDEDDEDMPFIGPITKAKENSKPKKARDSNNRPGGRVHNTISISKEDWEMLVKVMDITSSMIPGK